MLTQQEIAYGQQKNREHIWRQCVDEFKEKHNRHPNEWDPADEIEVDNRYLNLCEITNITPY